MVSIGSSIPMDQARFSDCEGTLRHCIVRNRFLVLSLLGESYEILIFVPNANPLLVLASLPLKLVPIEVLC